MANCISAGTAPHSGRPVRNCSAARPDLSTLTLEGAEIALLIDERDAASWDFAATAPAAPLSLHLANSSIRYFDARNGQALAIGDVTGDISIASDGQIGFIGSTDLRGQAGAFRRQAEIAAPRA